MARCIWGKIWKWAWEKEISSAKNFLGGFKLKRKMYQKGSPKLVWKVTQELTQPCWQSVGPPCSLLSHEKVALVQVATKSSVYIFDMLRLIELLSVHDWLEWNQKYFSNRMCTILGYGIKGDLLTISRSLSEPFADLAKTATSVVDLALLDRRLSSISAVRPLKKPFPTTVSGLSGLVESLFQKPLNKMDQMSDWDKRPLTKNQVCK